MASTPTSPPTLGSGDHTYTWHGHWAKVPDHVRLGYHYLNTGDLDGYR